MTTNVDRVSVGPKKRKTLGRAKFSLLIVATLAGLVVLLVLTGGQVEQYYDTVDPLCAGATNRDGSCVSP